MMKLQLLCQVAKPDFIYTTAATLERDLSEAIRESICLVSIQRDIIASAWTSSVAMYLLLSRILMAIIAIIGNTRSDEMLSAAGLPK